MVILTNHSPDARELEIIERQLGRKPRGIQAVAATDGEGTPLVLRMHSLVDGKPFPTLYWLCDERLKISLSRIEAEGVIKGLEERLKTDEELLARYRASHEAYVAERWSFMSEAARNAIESQGFADLMRERGVGGIRDWNQVRCLHTQYAQHLAYAEGNAIGHWVDAHYDVLSELP